jgi:hypothetical protein
MLELWESTMILAKAKTLLPISLVL